MCSMMGLLDWYEQEDTFKGVVLKGQVYTLFYKERAKADRVNKLLALSRSKGHEVQVSVPN